MSSISAAPSKQSSIRTVGKTQAQVSTSANLDLKSNRVLIGNLKCHPRVLTLNLNVQGK